MNNGTPDLRVDSLGMACLYGFCPLAPAGRKFVGEFAAKVVGQWDDRGIYWFSDVLASPYEVLRGSTLNIVSGIGDDSYNRRPWLGR